MPLLGRSRGSRGYGPALGGSGYRRSRRGGIKGRLLIALVIAGISLFSYYKGKTHNPVTGEDQYVDLSPQQEIALGLQAAPQMAEQYGGLHADSEAQRVVDTIGERLVRETAAGKLPYQYEFHVLADEETVNAFALPGGQVFITAALLSRLESEGQVAGVLGHEVGHVVARHGAEHMAKAKLTQGLTGAAVMASGSRSTAAVAAMIGNLINMKYGRGDELESDRLGVRFTAEAGYDPRSMMRVMEILAEAAGGGRQPEFFSTHPNPERRIERIQEEIETRYPGGLPGGLRP